MSKRTSYILSALIIFITAAVVGYSLWHSKTKSDPAADRAAVRKVVEEFGRKLNSVSLLSPYASRDIETHYRDLLDPKLLEQWKNNPGLATGRLTSSPWPDRIEIASLSQFGSGAYDVSGKIIEITSQEQMNGGVANEIQIDLSVVKYGDRWLIANVKLNDIASQLKDCLPKSDTASAEKCKRLLDNIKNFQDCVNAGFAIQKSNPPQCSTPDGKIFTEASDL